MIPCLFISALIIPFAHGCTNLLVSKAASADGSNIISYNGKKIQITNDVYI